MMRINKSGLQVNSNVGELSCLMGMGERNNGVLMGVKGILGDLMGVDKITPSYFTKSSPPSEASINNDDPKWLNVFFHRSFVHN